MNTKNNLYIIPFETVETPRVELLGGKGYNLLKMIQSKEKIPIPCQYSFVVTTQAYELFLHENNSHFSLDNEWQQLKKLSNSITESEMIQVVQEKCKLMRNSLLQLPIPQVVLQHIQQVIKNDINFTYAVRSSSVSEDAGATSFAGQHDTFLNVPGELSFVLDRLRKCWASSFTDRSVLYALYNIENAPLPKMAVVVQQMVFNPCLSGIIFTADPITNDRNTILMNVSYGLGEAIVSGKVNADSYSVRKDLMQITDKSINIKKIKTIAVKDQTILKDTIEEVEVEESLQSKACLNDKQILELAEIAIRIERYYENKFQDIEFAMSGEEGQIYIVQSRPITSLHKIPQYPTFYYSREKQEEKWTMPKSKRLMLSFNHVQVHPDPFTPFGLSMIRKGPLNLITSTFGLNIDEIYAELNGRLYVDLSMLLNTLPVRKTNIFGKVIGANADKIIGEAITRMYSDPFFVQHVQPLPLRNAIGVIRTFIKLPITMIKGLFTSYFKKHNIYEESLQIGNEAVENAMNALKETPSIVEYLKNVPRQTANLFSAAVGVAKNVFSAFVSLKILSSILPKDINTGELLAGVRLITTDMDLQLAKIGRIVATSDFLQQEIHHLIQSNTSKPIPASTVAEYFQTMKENEEAQDFLRLWNKFMEEHGHRGSGEIDITSTRFCEDSSMLLRIIVNSCSRTEEHADAIDNFAKKKEQVHDTIEQIQVIVRKEKSFLNGVSFGTWGRIKAAIILQLIQVVRNYFSVRETPKYLLIKLLTGIKLHLLKLVQESNLIELGVFDNATDIYWLYYEELLHICETLQREGKLEEQHILLVRQTIQKRRENFEKQKQFQAPRAVTSYGEYLDVRIKQEQAKLNKEKYKDQNVLVGSGVSSGVAVGRVCIVLDPHTATLKPGEILVVRQSDPGYNPLFLNCVALISEAGGYLTHGSVVARELNLPAVVGIDNVCKNLKQGQLVKVDGDEGVVTILEQ